MIRLRAALLLLFALLVSLAWSANLDYYKILGVSKSASERDIKSAYRRQSKKFHPDKHDGNDKEEASKRFVEISEAYEVLSSKEKRGIYDRHGHDGLKQHAQQGQAGGDGFHDPFDIFRSFFGGHGHQQQQGVRKGPNMVMDMEVDLADMYTGKTYEIQVERKTICEHCEGSGARSQKDIHECDACAGRGVRIVKHMLAPGMYQQVQMQCDRCGGRGRMIKHTCPHCQGQRIVTMKSDLSVDIDRGLPEGSELTFEGEADESPDWVAGDLIIRVRSRRVQGAFTRKNEHLYWKQPISIAEALLGFEHTIEHFDGHTVKLASNHGETTQPGFVQILHGEGLPRLHSSDYGDLYVEYSVVLPQTIKAATQKKLQEAFAYTRGPSHTEL